MANVIPFPPGISKDSIIGWVLVGIVARYDTHSIIKFPSTSSNRRFIEIETRIYDRLNDGEAHDGLLKSICINISTSKVPNLSKYGSFSIAIT
jgi:hypothetical protein